MADRSVVTTRYKPAYHRSDLMPGSANQAMDAFMLSEGVQRAADAAARDIAAAAVTIANAEIVLDTTHAYVQSIDARPREPVVINGNPRAAACVTAHGGTESWGGFHDPESSHAAVVEFGNPSAPYSGRRIFGRVAAAYSTPKAPM